MEELKKNIEECMDDMNFVQLSALLGFCVGLLEKGAKNDTEKRED